MKACCTLPVRSAWTISKAAPNWLGTSTVLYDIIKTCATAAPAPACGAYSVTGPSNTPTLAFEYEWFNGTSVPDPAGDINGFGFYQPMFESPADVVCFWSYLSDQHFAVVRQAVRRYDHGWHQQHGRHLLPRTILRCGTSAQATTPLTPLSRISIRTPELLPAPTCAAVT